MGLLDGKNGIIFGIANKRSIAWAIAQAVAREGARLALTYQGERLKENVEELAEKLDKPAILPCDVSDDEAIGAVFQDLKKEFGRLDFVVHAVAYALREDLEGHFVDTSREGYRIAQDVSSYSLTTICKHALPLMKHNGGSIVALTYLGGEKVIPHYNVMGVAKAALDMSVRYLAYDLGEHNIRVNAISAGPIKTLASAGVSGIGKMIKHHQENSPLKRNTETAEVADAALFLCSNLSRGITGEILHVDNGYSIMGMSM